MLLRRESLDDFLLRTILFVDPEQRTIDFLSGILATMRAKSDTGKIEAAGVSTLEAARNYIDTHKPYTLILDPAISSIEEVLDFIAYNRTLHPRMVWVINTPNSWWRRHDKLLSASVLGNRIKNYFRLDKNAPTNQRRIDFVNTLTLCQYDLVLGLLGETTEEMRQSAVEMTRPQVAKFAGKALADIRSLKKLLVDQPGRGDAAVVSMKSSDGQERLYRKSIEKVLRSAGFRPTMIAYDASDGPHVTLDILDQIEGCGLFVADLSGLRPQAIFDFGAASVLQKPTILLVDASTAAMHDLTWLGAHIHVYSSERKLSGVLRKALEPMTQSPTSN